MRSYATIFTLACTLLAFASCSRRGDDGSTPPPAPVTRTASGDGVTLTLRVDRDDVPFPQRVRLEVEILAEAGVVVTPVDYEAALKQRPYEYRAAPLEDRSAEPTPDGRRRWLRTFDLEFFAPGDYELPGPEIAYVAPTDSAAPAAGDAAQPPTSAETAPAEQSLTTEALTIHARLPADAATTEETLGKIDMPAPVDLPREPIRWGRVLLWGAAGAALLAAAAWLWLVQRRRRAAIPPPPVPPADWAMAELDRLLAERLLEQGQVQAFYFRLSGIVREYVERGFDVSAPEQTTEEFLRNLKADVALGREDKAALGRFLAACDLVKFARHEPLNAEHEEAVSASRDFVTRTADRTRVLGAQRALKEAMSA